ncbi:2-C-methyl-D-erythritol 4-phosphate cytidylyltransferase [Celerinatantimonas yamalensis]|uniref:2-C-methyl-D-erythritol 4-phosphate cytidylyltransferase n=1 Tax=Celerinatantimonas yamalensis TaxID=559956 RepID=A0ABW9G979_9GAMM
MIKQRFSAVIPAAGIGQRMAADSPKQYLPINGKAILSYSVELFLDEPSIAQVVIALHPDDHWFNQLAISKHPKVTTVIGGAERVDSVLAALAQLSDDDWVLVHDAARPCLTPTDLHKLLTLAQKGESAILACPVRDTMKWAGATGLIEHTVDRRALWHAMTPQSFNCGLLRQVLKDAVNANVHVTDEASAMEWAGFAVRLVRGRYDNLKVTHPEDLPLAEFLIARQTR